MLSSVVETVEFRRPSSPETAPFITCLGGVTAPFPARSFSRGLPGDGSLETGDAGPCHAVPQFPCALAAEFAGHFSEFSAFNGVAAAGAGIDVEGVLWPLFEWLFSPSLADATDAADEEFARENRARSLASSSPIFQVNKLCRRDILRSKGAGGLVKPGSQLWRRIDCRIEGPSRQEP